VAVRLLKRISQLPRLLRLEGRLEWRSGAAPDEPSSLKVGGRDTPIGHL
jgi:hypothetical protein